MSYSVSDQRKQTMLKRVGEAAQLIDDHRFLPFYRSIQLRLERMGKPDEWAHMIETAKAKTTPSRYFAKLCKMVKDGTYRFAEKVEDIANATKLFLSDKLVKFGFGKFQKYWVRKAHDFIQQNSQADFIELLEYAERKNVSQKYFAKALLNGKSPKKYYTDNIMGATK